MESLQVKLHSAERKLQSQQVIYNHVLTLSQIYNHAPTSSQIYNHVLTLSQIYNHVLTLSQIYNVVLTLSQIYNHVLTISQIYNVVLLRRAVPAEGARYTRPLRDNLQVETTSKEGSLQD